MTVDDLYKLTLFILDKEKIGSAFTDDQYNLVLPESQWIVINNEIKKVFIGEFTPASDEIIENSPLRTLKTIIDATSLSLPKDYIRFTSLRADYGNGFLLMEPISDKMAIERSNNVYFLANLHPFCSISKESISPVPNNPVKIELNYLQKPSIAFRDFCQNKDILESIFMPIGSVIHEIDIDSPQTIYALYDSANNKLVDNVIKENVTYPYTSKTIELVLPEEIHESILLAILSKCGVNLSADQITAYAETKEKEQ